MKKTIYFLKLICFAIIYLFIFASCSNNQNQEEKQEILNNKEEKESTLIESEKTKETNDYFNKTIIETTSSEPEIVEIDWAKYFNGFHGTAVLYDVSNKQYLIFQPELALIQRSPCSTFKIISSLIALEKKIIEPNNTTRLWSGEVFWNEKWNHNIDFREAFRESCVWYFREVIDEIGKDILQEELNKLQYGNCDISDWQGKLNTNNQNPDLTGFWIESSLLISPKEQTEVMERIFGANSIYSKETQNELRQVMQVTEQEKTDISIYGKTGMGKAEGVVVDAWFTGFAEGKEGNLYFCIYLGRTDQKEVSSIAAKEIAISLISDYYK